MLTVFLDPTSRYALNDWFGALATDTVVETFKPVRDLLEHSNYLGGLVSMLYRPPRGCRLPDFR